MSKGEGGLSRKIIFNMWWFQQLCINFWRISWSVSLYRAMNAVPRLSSFAFKASLVLACAWGGSLWPAALNSCLPARCTEGAGGKWLWVFQCRPLSGAAAPGLSCGHVRAHGHPRKGWLLVLQCFPGQRHEPSLLTAGKRARSRCCGVEQSSWWHSRGMSPACRDGAGGADTPRTWWSALCVQRTTLLRVPVCLQPGQRNWMGFPWTHLVWDLSGYFGK